MGLWEWLSRRTEGKRPERPDEAGGQEIPEVPGSMEVADDEPSAADEPRSEDDGRQ